MKIRDPIANMKFVVSMFDRIFILLLCSLPVLCSIAAQQ